MTKRHFKKPERSQMMMVMNVDLDSIAAPGGVLRTIDTLVDALDTSAIEAKYNLTSPLGAEPFHPKTLLKVALYAMYSCRFSLRKMEEDTKANLGYMWLTGNKSIDHATLGHFFSRHPLLISDLLAQVVNICGERDLIDFDILSIDSVKIRANASYKQFRNQEGIEKEQEKIRQKLAALIGSALREETELRDTERRLLEARLEKLNEAKEILTARISEKSKKKSETEQSEIVKSEKVNVTDPDCYLTKQGNGEINPGYAFSTATDTKADVMTAVTEHEGGVNDAASLLPTISESKKNCGENHDTVSADSGFSTIDNLETLETVEQDALIPDKRMDVEQRGETKRGAFDRSNFKFDEESNQYTCPAGVILVLTAVFLVNGRKTYRYENRSACASCPLRGKCTKGEYRSISRDFNEEIRERMRERLRAPDNATRYKMRAHAAESPFGVIKQNRKFRNFMRRGKEKVKMEFTMQVMLHNILKMQVIG